MKKLQKAMPAGRQGFTMIELLIVIAVLGILAVAVLSAINPIEQINRSRDTGSRSDAEQLVSAIDRYYTAKGYYPWSVSANSDQTMCDFTPLIAADTVCGGNTDAQEVLNNLSSGGTSELKASFVTRITSTSARTLSIFNTGTGGDSTYVCFLPQSSSFRDEAMIRCKETEGALPVDFPESDVCPADNSCTGAADASEATGCYICLP